MHIAIRERRPDERDRARPCPADPRQPRQPDGRGRRPAASGARSGAPRCPRAPRPGTREALELRDGDGRSAARACAARSRTSTARSRPPCAGRDAADQRGLDEALIALDGTRGQVAPRRQRDPRRVDGGRARGGRGRRTSRCGATWAATEATLLPVPMHERAQRRRPRRQPGRLPGVHDRSGRRRLVRAGDPDGRRGLPRAAAHAEEPRPRARPSATRAGSRRRSSPTRRRSSCS